MAVVCGQEMNINNTQFSLLEASEDFMATVLMLLSGIITDRVGGAGTTPVHSFSPLSSLHNLHPHRSQRVHHPTNK
jgi:hypothetical protein